MKTTLAMFHHDYQYEETNIITDVKRIEFFTKGKIEVNKGWKALFSKEEQENKENDSDKNKSLPDVNKDDMVSAALEIKEGQTTPPKRKAVLLT